MTKIEKSRFSQAIKRYREEKELTQQELARKLLTTETTIARWETGMSTPKNERMIEGIKRLGIHW